MIKSFILFIKLFSINSSAAQYSNHSTVKIEIHYDHVTGTRSVSFPYHRNLGSFQFYRQNRNHDHDNTSSFPAIYNSPEYLNLTIKEIEF